MLSIFQLSFVISLDDLYSSVSSHVRMVIILVNNDDKIYLYSVRHL